MATVFGKQLGKKELLGRAGSMAQLAYIRHFEYMDGKADGIKAFDVANGTGLEFIAIESKCLDVISMKYKGMNLSYLPKTGIVAPGLVDMSGTELLRSISGGMLYSCGLLNVGDACTDEGNSQIFHGRIKITPTEHVNPLCYWEGDDYILSLSGEVREAALYGDNIIMKRTVSTRMGAKCIKVCDEIENQNFREEGLMLLYHINAGYPVVDEGARYVAPVMETIPYNDAAKADMANCMKIIAPEYGYNETVYMHKISCDKDGISGTAVINDALGIGVYVKYDTSMLPCAWEWKSMQAGDYAFGMCPSTGNINGRAYEREHGSLRKVEPFGRIKFELEIGVLEGEKEIKSFEESIGV